MRVAGNHTDVVAAEYLHQIKELFADQGLDGGRVITAFALCHAHKEHAQRDERLARSGRCAQNDVIAGGQVHEGLFLVVPQLNTAIARPFKEAFEGLVGREPWFGLAAVLGLPPGGGERAERAELGLGSRTAREGAGGAGAGDGAGGGICRGLCHVVAFSRDCPPSIMA